MRAVLLAILLLGPLALVPGAAAGQPCTTPPKDRVQAIVWAASCRLEDVRPVVDAVEVGTVVIDLRWMTACPGPWGHEERSQVGPVVIVTYECDDGGV